MWGILKELEDRARERSLQLKPLEKNPDGYVDACEISIGSEHFSVTVRVAIEATAEYEAERKARVSSFITEIFEDIENEHHEN